MSLTNINEDIGKVSKNLMFKEPFYGLFLMSLNKDVNEQVKETSISKNSINCQLSINPNYWKGLSEKHKEGVLKHQLIHLAFQHVLDRDNFSDKEVFDIATDLEVNQYITPENRPESFKIPSDYKEYNLKPRDGFRSYYNILLKEKKKNPEGFNSNFGKDSKDDHESWGEFTSEGEAQTELIKRQIKFQLKETYESLKIRGLIPGELAAHLSELFKIEPPVFNWKAYLRRYMLGSRKYYTKKTRRKLNLRFPDNPALKIKPKARILIGIDTSGSVSEIELKDFFNEIYHVWKTGVIVDIIECDARAYPVYEYKGKREGKVHGRGGKICASIYSNIY